LQFTDPGTGYHTGYLAFTRDAEPLLLVSDAGAEPDTGAVHLVDVVDGTHVGYVAPPGTIKGPRGVAACSRYVAVSAWRSETDEQHVVHLYQCGEDRASWVRTFTLGGPRGDGAGLLALPRGLRFIEGSDTGPTLLAVAEEGNGRVSVFECGEGAPVFKQTLGEHYAGARDVEVCDDHVLVSATHHGCRLWFCAAVAGGQLVDSEGGYSSFPLLSLRDESPPWALAVSPRVGLILRNDSYGGRP
jgi:hypothetical protein